MSQAEMIKKNFENHVATIKQYHEMDKDGIGVLGTIDKLTWKKPGSSNYMIQYIISGNTLCVYGDLGEAIYRWCEPITFEWIAGLNLSYFKGKCQASEVGRDFREWDEKKALDALKYFAKEEYFKWKEFEEREGKHALYDNSEWNEWLREHGDEVLGEEFWDWAYGIGYTINVRCIYHFIGLHMAMEQIRGDKKEFVIAT